MKINISIVNARYFHLVKMDCLEGYKILNRISDDMWSAENITGKFMIKIIKGTEIDNNELAISLLMSDNNISPKIYDHRLCDGATPSGKNSLVIMQKPDGSLLQLWSFITQKRRKQVTIVIDNLIRQMHNLGIAHGDLHGQNIGYKENIGSITFFILNYGNSFYILEGKDDPKVINWMENSFDWEDSYESFVNYDFENWKSIVRFIPVPKELLFNNLFDEDTIYKYLNGDCGLLAVALNKRSGWPIYGISQDNGAGDISIPYHYVIRTPGGEFFIEITGVRSQQYLRQYWSNYLLEQDETNLTIAIYEVDDVLCNIDYYNDMFNSTNTTDLDNIASIIWTTILERYNISSW